MIVEKYEVVGFENCSLIFFKNILNLNNFLEMYFILLFKVSVFFFIVKFMIKLYIFMDSCI